jgi:para-nitrobenzyl esterase
LWPPFTGTDSKVLYLGAPIIVGGVANINSLKVFDSVYTMVRGTAFASR